MLDFETALWITIAIYLAAGGAYLGLLSYSEWQRGDADE